MDTARTVRASLLTAGDRVTVPALGMTTPLLVEHITERTTAGIRYVEVTVWTIASAKRPLEQSMVSLTLDPAFPVQVEH